MWAYRLRLERDLARWRERGLVTPEAAAEILAEVRADRSGPSLAGVLSTLAAVLMGFAAMSFVAANWQDMPKWLRLGLITLALGASHGFAAWLFQRGRDAFAHAATLAASALFGAALMLISLMYHADGHPPELLLVWGLVALVTGAAVRSPPSLALAMVLFGGWSAWESGLRHAVHLPFLIPWAVTALAFLSLRWRPGLHLAALALGLWIVGLGSLIDDPRSHMLVAGIGVAVTAAGALATRGPEPWRTVGPAVVAYGTAIAFAGFFAIQFVQPLLDGIGSTGPRPGPDVLVMRALPALAFLAAVILWGMARSHAAVVGVAVAALSVELFALLIDGRVHWLVALSGAGVAGLALAGERRLGWSVLATRSAVVYGAGMAFLALYAWQFWQDPPSGAPRTLELVILAVLALILVISLVSWATRHGLRRVQWAAFAAFSVEVFSLYVNTIGTLLGTSLFLLVASLIVGALAWLAIRLHERGRAATPEVAR